MCSTVECNSNFSNDQTSVKLKLFITLQDLKLLKYLKNRYTSQQSVEYSLYSLIQSKPFVIFADYFLCIFPLVFQYVY